MNSDQVNGGLDQTAGRMKGAAAALADDTGAQAKAKLQAAAGKAKSIYGDTRETIDDASAQMKDKLLAVADKAQGVYGDARETIETQVVGKPLAAMAAIGAVGLAAGLLLGAAGRKERRDRG